MPMLPHASAAENVKLFSSLPAVLGVYVTVAVVRGGSGGMQLGLLSGLQPGGLPGN
jgi:hypothetical protein